MFHALAASLLVLSASQPPRTFAERAALADRVVLAKVRAAETVVEAGRLLTVTTFDVEETWRGAAGAQVEVVQLGGARAGYVQRVAGDATFSTGERVLLLLRCAKASDGRCRLVALGEGKLPVRGTDAVDAREGVLPLATARRVVEAAR